jgi:cytidyltransferase-like protein
VIGVYWGAFDPLTKAHKAIIEAALKKLNLKKLLIVMNNHGYKKYLSSLGKRKEVLSYWLKKEGLNAIEILSQEEGSPIDYQALLQIEKPPFVAIAGYDAYLSWKDKSFWDSIAVVPRRGELPVLQEERAFLLEIEPKYKNISSSQVKKEKM